jgi:GT2 family glycosyltransferase
MSSRRARVTLAVPCLDAERWLADVLAGAARQTRPPDELLVVDDGSRDGTAELARRLGARVLAHGKNLGLAAARNTALAEARGDLLVFVDADAVPHCELVERLAAPLEGSPGATPAAASGGQVIELPRGGESDRWRRSFWRQTLGGDPLDDAPFVIGACSAFSRAALLEAGGFSAAFRTNGEDVEVSLRLRRLGRRLAYDPRAVVFHHRSDRLASLLSMVFRHQRDHVRALRLHGYPPATLLRRALVWGPISLGSSLKRHLSPPLAALSALGYGASLAGCLAGLAAPGP